jgi:hypothetical protein
VILNLREGRLSKKAGVKVTVTQRGLASEASTLNVTVIKNISNIGHLQLSLRLKIQLSPIPSLPLFLISK